MKDLLKSFTTFSRTERMGLIGLISLLFILLAVRVTMHYWVKPYHNEVKEKELQVTWEKFKKRHTDTASVESIPLNSNIEDSITPDK